jgi:mRNA interferase RelE/StbE
VARRIELKKSAEKEFLALEELIKHRIKSAILALADNPKPNGFKKLQNKDGYRIRVGDYRILYTIDNITETIFIYAIGHRRDIYK